MMKTRWPRSALGIALMSLGLVGGACAQGSAQPGPTPASSAGTPAVSDAARQFAQQAAIGGLFEIEMAHVAQQQAASAEVKQFARRMLTDHSKADEQLQKAADAQGIELPAMLDERYRQEKERLQKLSGKPFDRAYMKTMVEDRRNDIAAFAKEASSGQDSAITQFAAQTLPMLKEHLSLAESTQKTLQDGQARGSGK